MRRLVAIAGLTAGVVTVVAGGHYYMARRLVLDPGLPEPWRGLGLAGIVVLGALLVAAPFAERGLPPRWSRLVVWPAAVWMGLAFLLLILLAGTDLLLALGGAAAWAAGAAPPDLAATARARALAVVAVALVAGAAGLRGGLRPPGLRRLEIRLARWPRALDGFRIVQLSDIHIGAILGRRFARRLVDRVNALAPDLVAVTGDLVDGSVARLGDEVAPFADLRAPHGVWFVTGNHDHYAGVGRWMPRIAELGLRPLRNERVTIGKGESSFDLAGVDDAHGSLVSGVGGGEDLDRALAGRDPARPVVLLAHDPSTFKRAWRRGVDLQISGHTHGGQIWPFGLLVRLAIPYVAGLHAEGASRLYVSRGTGFWGPPLRLFAPAEITEIALRCGAEA